MSQKSLNFYKTQGKRTAITKEFVNQFPDDISGIVEFVQNILIHKGRAVKEEDLANNHDNPAFDLKTNLQIIEKIEGVDISQPILVKDKVVCICRNYTMLLVAVLREKGFPARARCGFGMYFGGGDYEDHWICEYWSKEQARWIQVDAQMDSYWKEMLHLNNSWFNHLDMKRGQFLNGGQVWKLYREGIIDGDICGFSPEGLLGEYYIRENMMRDFFALNNVEPTYGEDLPLAGKNLSQEDLERLDYISRVTQDPDMYFDEMQKIFSELV